MEIDYGQSLTEAEESALGDMLIATKTREVSLTGSFEGRTGVALVSNGPVTATEMRLVNRRLMRIYGIPGA